MSNDPEKIKAGYRDRLREGQTVYLVDGIDEDSAGLTVYRAVVVKAGQLARPVIRPWSYRQANPPRFGNEVMRNPRQLFTEAEVERAMYQSDGYLNTEKSIVDEVVNSAGCEELAIVLGGITLARMVDVVLDMDDVRRSQQTKKSDK